MVGLWLAALLAAAPCAPQLSVRGPGLPDDVVAAFATDARDVVVEVRARLGSTSCEPLTITLVPAMRDASVLDPPWHLPSWAAGAAAAGDRRIVVGVTADGVRQDRRRILVHEVAHVVAAEASGGRRLPRWLDEGIARYTASEHGIEDLSLLAHARLADRFFPLASLVDGFPPHAADASLAYAESGRAVSLVAGKSSDAIPRLLALLSTGLSVDDALSQVYGRASWQLDRDVQQSLSGWASLAVVGVETDFAMALCATVVAAYGFRARRRLRQRILAMDDGDEPQPGLVVVRFIHGPPRRSTG
jgi:hypothetical protein